MPRRGSHFLCFAKESNQRKATPTFALILRCSQQAGDTGHRTDATLRVGKCDAVPLGPPVAPLLGVEYTGTPSDQILVASRWITNALHGQLSLSRTACIFVRACTE